MSELPDILLFAVAVIGLFVCLWPRKPKREKVDNDVTRAGEGLRPFVESMKDVDKRGKELYERCKNKGLEDFKAKVRRDYREWYGRDIPP